MVCTSSVCVKYETIMCVRLDFVACYHRSFCWLFFHHFCCENWFFLFAIIIIEQFKLPFCCSKSLVGYRVLLFSLLLDRAFDFCLPFVRVFEYSTIRVLGQGVSMLSDVSVCISLFPSPSSVWPLFFSVNHLQFQVNVCTYSITKLYYFTSNSMKSIAFLFAY